MSRARVADELGYTTITVSKRANRALLRQAIETGRTPAAQLDIILGV